MQRERGQPGNGFVEGRGLDSPEEREGPGAHDERPTSERGTPRGVSAGAFTSDMSRSYPPAGTPPSNPWWSDEQPSVRFSGPDVEDHEAAPTHG